jgi:hypothetical protein
MPNREENAMKKNRILFVAALLPAVSWGCYEPDYSYEEPPRIIRITATAPADGARTNARQSFALLVEDSHQRHEELRVTVTLDGENPVVCEHAREETPTIDGVIVDDVFRCPVDAGKIDHGDRVAVFEVSPPSKDAKESEEGEEKATEDADETENDLLVRKIHFNHDPNPPVLLHSSLHRNAQGVRVLWTVRPTEKRVEVQGYLRGLRVFSSQATEGQVWLDGDYLTPGATFELFAYDDRGNQQSYALRIP